VVISGCFRPLSFSMRSPCFTSAFPQQPPCLSHFKSLRQNTGHLNSRELKRRGAETRIQQHTLEARQRTSRRLVVHITSKNHSCSKVGSSKVDRHDSSEVMRIRSRPLRHQTGPEGGESKNVMIEGTGNKTRSRNLCLWRTPLLHRAQWRRSSE
jgi:hypothetical protein